MDSDVPAMRTAHSLSNRTKVPIESSLDMALLTYEHTDLKDSVWIPGPIKNFGRWSTAIELFQVVQNTLVLTLYVSGLTEAPFTAISPSLQRIRVDLYSAAARARAGRSGAAG